MRRARHDLFRKTSRRRYVVLWDVLWRLIECVEIPAHSDPRSGFLEAIDRCRTQGWQAEGSAQFGFVFLSRGADRRLLVLTERNPSDGGEQAFSPYR
jgi:hypothetical protein